MARHAMRVVGHLPSSCCAFGGNLRREILHQHRRVAADGGAARARKVCAKRVEKLSSSLFAAFQFVTCSSAALLQFAISIRMRRTFSARAKDPAG